MKLASFFFMCMVIGFLGYTLWGDPVHWSFLVPVAFVAAVITLAIEPKSP